jgi:hypothetical protein
MLGICSSFSDRNLPRAIVLALPLVIVCYVLVNVAYLSVMTAAQIASSSAVAVVSVFFSTNDYVIIVVNLKWLLVIYICKEFLFTKTRSSRFWRNLARSFSEGSLGLCPLLLFCLRSVQPTAQSSLLEGTMESFTSCCLFVKHDIEILKCYRKKNY